MAARRPGPALGAEGLSGQADLRLRDRRQHRRAQVADRIEDFRIDYEMFSETLPDDAFPKGADWLSSVPQDRDGCGSPSSIWRSIAAASASSRSRPAMGDQADQDG